MFVSARSSVSGEATILHADLDAFYASVEQRDDPRLRGRPVIVGGGVVLVLQLRGAGVRGAHGDGRSDRPGSCARGRSSSRPGCRRTPKRARRCSRCSTTPRRSSRGCRSTKRSSTWAACGESSGTPTEIAVQLRKDVLERVGLPITVGVARTKFLAKVASGVAKPDGLLVVPPEGELAFLHPLPRRASLGRRAEHRRQAPRAWHHDGGRRRPTSRGVARLDARARVGPPPARARRTTSIRGP